MDYAEQSQMAAEINAYCNCAEVMIAVPLAFGLGLLSPFFPPAIVPAAGTVMYLANDIHYRNATGTGVSERIHQGYRRFVDYFKRDPTSC